MTSEETVGVKIIRNNFATATVVLVELMESVAIQAKAACLVTVKIYKCVTSVGETFLAFIQARDVSSRVHIDHSKYVCTFKRVELQF